MFGSRRRAAARLLAAVAESAAIAADEFESHTAWSAHIDARRPHVEAREPRVRSESGRPVAVILACSSCPWSTVVSV